ncbi:MAG: hypothetical protein Pg6C_17130 [Treponemataceae bacterium]|nr:MAG: hypothetical protein Pg6C_17130 [Treponemataceae bacterium]
MGYIVADFAYIGNAAKYNEVSVIPDETIDVSYYLASYKVLNGQSATIIHSFGIKGIRIGSGVYFLIF